MNKLSVRTGIPLLSEKWYKIAVILGMILCHSLLMLAAPIYSASPVQNIRLSLLLYIGMCVMYIPLPCVFLIPTEGFIHTSNKQRYLKGIFMMAIISELPYDLARMASKHPQPGMPFPKEIHKPIHFIFENWEEATESQNVMFTIAIGFITLWCIEYLLENISYIKAGKACSQLIASVSVMCATFLGAYSAYLIKADHGWWMIIAMVIIYITRKNRLMMCLTLILFLEGINFLFLSNPFLKLSFIGCIFIFLYNGRRGNINTFSKRFFYWFYPGQFVFIFALQCLIGPH